VLGLDYFFGDPISNHSGDDKFDLQAWLKIYREKAAEATPKWIKAVQEIYGDDAIYTAVGYCFGAPFVMDIAATDQVVASAFAHPAFLEEDHFRSIKKPLLLSCAETDMTFPTDKRHRAEDILAEVKATYHVQVFSGVVHGWALRADLTDENARWAKEESARSIIEWFKRFSTLKQSQTRL
jgi:dienelactone hydrolase